ncbi:MAG TPA: universal stress protein [Lacipirellula sp.]
MYRSILVPLDGSAAAEHALPMALGLARRFGAELNLVTVHVPPLGLYGHGGWYNEPADRELRAMAQGYIDGITGRVSAVAGISVRSTLLDGSIVGAINLQAQESGADLIVMTTRGRGQASRFWLGSVADLLLRQSTMPILFVRPEESSADLSQEPSLRRMLVPLDGSPLAEQILEPAVALATGTQAEIDLLRVVEQLMPESYALASSRVGGLRPELLAQLEEAGRQEQICAEEYLDHLAERLRSRSLNVQTRVVSHVRAATAIIDDASAHGVDLIALATQGRGGLKRLLVGSVADKVIRGATTPVLAYRPAGEFAEEDQ